MKTTLALLLVSVAAIEHRNIPYSSTLKCGGCILGGYNFCFQGTDGQQVSATPISTCCQDSTCAENTNTAYSCSSAFTSLDYAITMCPQMTSQCGNTKDFTPATPGDTSTVEVTGLLAGESCTFHVKSQCGAPGFLVKSESTVTAA